MMDHRSTDSLVQFCIHQRFTFDAGAWRRRGAADGKVIALTAKPEVGKRAAILNLTNRFVCSLPRITMKKS